MFRLIIAIYRRGWRVMHLLAIRREYRWNEWEIYRRQLLAQEEQNDCQDLMCSTTNENQY
jgi:hypothetical protein